jgi:hypothetical protein
MIYELRIYHCLPGRRPALLKRFQEATLEIWKKHGIRQAGFWTPSIGPDMNLDLYYLLAWESLEERDRKWGAFAADPEWAKKRAESEKNGQIVESITNMILEPAAFSAVK